MPTLLANLIGKMLDIIEKPLWAGPCDEGLLGGITQSMLQRYVVCRERFRLKYVLGLEPPDKFSKSREYGNMWHACEEAHAANKPWEDALDAYTAKLRERYPIQRDEMMRWWNVCRVQFPVYVDFWANHPDVLDRQPLMQEQVFNVPYHLPSGRTIRLRGKFDSVDLIPSQGGVYIQENKTKGDIDQLTVERTLKFDIQTMMYQIALKELVSLDPHAPWHSPTHPICGVRYNVIRRPLSGGKGSIQPHKEKTTKARYGTGKNAGKLLAPAKFTPGETDEQFFARLRDDYILAAPEYWFFRVISRVSVHDMMEFRKQFLDPILENLADDFEWWAWCLENHEDHWDMARRQSGFPDHANRHWRYPFGVYNSLDEMGSSEYDHYLATGSDGGLRRREKLFPELEDQ